MANNTKDITVRMVEMKNAQHSHAFYLVVDHNYRYRADFEF